MAATAQWYEDNGAATGSPAKGTTRTLISDPENSGPQNDFKSVDDVTTSASDAKITAGQNSFHKYRFVKFSGSFSEISSVKFAHTAGNMGAGTTLAGKVTSTYQTPSMEALSGATDISVPTTIDGGQAVLLATSGPEATSPSNKLTAEGYTQYMVTQLQTQTTATAGRIGDKTMTLQWNEN